MANVIETVVAQNLVTLIRCILRKGFLKYFTLLGVLGKAALNFGRITINEIKNKNFKLITNYILASLKAVLGNCVMVARNIAPPTFSCN